MSAGRIITRSYGLDLVVQRKKLRLLVLSSGVGISRGYESTKISLEPVMNAELDIVLASRSCAGT